MNSFLNLEVSPPLAYIVGICAFLNALLIAGQGYMRIAPKLGFRQGSKLCSIAMFVVAAWLMIRCMTAFQTKTVTLNVILLVIAILFWRLVDMRDYVSRSKKTYKLLKALDEPIVNHVQMALA